MDNEKLEKANQLNRRIEILKDNIRQATLMQENNNNNLSLHSNGRSFYVDVNCKQTILALTKSLLETDLKKLQDEFDAL